MNPTDFENALWEAEESCFNKLCEILGLTKGQSAFISVNSGKTDCMVFDIGYPASAEVMGFPSETFHWRGTAEFYSRDRRKLQRWLMRMVAAMPIATTQSTLEPMPDGSCVCGFRLCADTTPVTEITTTELKESNTVKGVEVFTVKASFDIIFNTGSRSNG